MCNKCSNITERIDMSAMRIRHDKGKVICWSYAVIIALKDLKTEEVIITNAKYSPTTTRHLNNFLHDFARGCHIQDVEQDDIDLMAERSNGTYQ